MAVENRPQILQEKTRVQSTHHWSGPIDDATDNGCRNDDVIQLGPLRSAVAVSVCPDQWWVFCELLLQYSPHAVINWIHIWHIWRPQLRWDRFWSFFI